MTESPTRTPLTMSFDLGPVVVKPDQTPDTSACDDTVAETPSPDVMQSICGTLEKDFEVSLLTSSPDDSPANSSHGDEDEDEDEATFLEQVKMAMVENEQKHQVNPPETRKTEKTFTETEAQTALRENKHPAVSPSVEATISSAPSKDEGNLAPTSHCSNIPQVTPIKQRPSQSQATPPSVRTSTLNTLSSLFPSPQVPTPKPTEKEEDSSEEEELGPITLFSNPQPPRIVNESESPTTLAPKALFTEEPAPKNQEPAWKRPPGYSSNASRYSHSLKAYAPQPVLKKEPVPTTVLTAGRFLPASLGLTPSTTLPSRPVSNDSFDNWDAWSTTESSVCPFDCTEDYKNGTFPESPTACILKSTIPHPRGMLPQKDNDTVSEMGIEGAAQGQKQPVLSKNPARRLTNIFSKVMGGKGVPSPRELKQAAKPTAAIKDKPAPPTLQPRLPIDSGILDLEDYYESQEIMFMELARTEEKDFEKQQPELEPQLTKSMSYDEDKVLNKEPKSMVSSLSKRKWTWCIILMALLLIVIIVPSVLVANKSSNNSSKNLVAGVDNTEHVNLVEPVSPGESSGTDVPSPAPVVPVPVLHIPGSGDVHEVSFPEPGSAPESGSIPVSSPGPGPGTAPAGPDPIVPGVGEPQDIDNSQCMNAITILEIGASVAGTTTDATVDDVEACGNVDDSTPGVWFRVDTMDHNELLSADVLSTGGSAFIGQVSLFSGGSCQSLVCEAGSTTGNLSWNAQQDTTYYLRVNGRDDPPADFELNIGFDPALVPSNSVCPAAMNLMPDDPVLLGSTTHASLPNVASCGNPAVHTAPGVWFKVRGSGNFLSASTCNPETNFNTTLTLYRDNCNSLECVDVNFQDRTSCGEQSSMTWFATDQEDYFVLVSGSRSGDFGLSIQEIQLDVGFDCTSALQVAPAASSPIFGSTDLASDIFVGCGDGTSAGVWHRVEGTGEDVTASTCHPGTNFDARISVLKGSCGSLICTDAVDTNCGEQMFTTWPTVAGAVYYLLVHGSAIGSAGEFVLTVEEGATPTVEDNNSISGGSCASAIGPLLINSDTVLDSTIISAFGNSGTCVGNTDPSRGTWYVVPGLGTMLTADTCSEHTDFDTEIHVFAGDCDNLLCVASNDDSDACGQQSSVSWDALSGTSYLILVRGAGANEFGNFGLHVSLASGPFFGN